MKRTRQARGAGVAAIHETDLGLAGLDGGQDYAGIIEKEGALPDRVPQSERLQVSTCVVAERTGGISQSDALYGRLQQAARAVQFGDSGGRGDSGQAIAGQQSPRF